MTLPIDEHLARRETSRMAFITCSACHSPFRPQDTLCPHCGANHDTSRTLSAPRAAAVIMGFAVLSACGDETSSGTGGSGANAAFYGVPGTGGSGGAQIGGSGGSGGDTGPGGGGQAPLYGVAGSSGTAGQDTGGAGGAGGAAPAYGVPATGAGGG